MVTLAQLMAIGWSPSAVRARVAAGRLHRLHRGVYAVGHAAVGARGRYLAAVLACGPGSVLSHCSAAALWGIRPSQGTRVDVTVPTRAGRRRDGLRIHRGDKIADSEATVVAGIPLTTVARTVVDLAGVLAMGGLEYAIHRAQARRILDRDAIIDVLAGSKRPGAAKVRRITGISGLGEVQARSLLELRFLRICRRAGIAQPRVNTWIALPDGHGLEVDFCWPEPRLIVETDGATFHRTARAIENDSARDRLLTLAGWRVARFTYRDVGERPEAVAAQMRRLLAA